LVQVFRDAGISGATVLRASYQTLLAAAREAYSTDGGRSRRAGGCRRYLKPCLEPVFHADSYGYRSGRSAIDAVCQTRQRCWRYDWVLDIDIKAFFGSLDHALLLRAVQRHTGCPWVLLYVERWLRVPMQREDGVIEPCDAGTPQGGEMTP
jgi:RNA-directed DNA polymerase